MQVFTCISVDRAHNVRVPAIDRVFKALADPTRRKLIDRLHASSGQTLTALCQHLAMSRQAVTQHLALLEAANLVTSQRQGREKLHYFNPVPIHDLYQRWISKFEQPRLEALRLFKTNLEHQASEEHSHDADPSVDDPRNRPARTPRVRHLHRDHG